MKKVLFVLLLVIISSFISCGEDDDTYCWEFNVTQVTSVSGASIPGYPQTIKSQTVQCNLTEKEADDVCNKMSGETTSTISGYTVRIKTTVTKKKTDKTTSKQPDYERVPI
jgi:hypothetical protein